MKTYLLTYVCGPFTMRFTVEALDPARAELTGRLDLNERLSVKGVAKHYGMQFRGRYELESCVEVRKEG